jgi:hypothetical protein
MTLTLHLADCPLPKTRGHWTPVQSTPDLTRKTCQACGYSWGPAESRCAAGRTDGSRCESPVFADGYCRVHDNIRRSWA